MDELIKRLRDAAIIADSGNAISESLYSDILQAADAIEELICEVADEHNERLDAEERQRWIPVTERLPLLNTPVLATDGIEVDISWMYGVSPRWITSYTAIDEDKLTHWMPLPKTPREES